MTIDRQQVNVYVFRVDLYHRTMTYSLAYIYDYDATNLWEWIED